jgi:site-specific DNA-methyltransferase (adenine-specific)
MDFMKSTPDKHFDIAIVDPPYGISAGKAMLPCIYNPADAHTPRYKLHKSISARFNALYPEAPPIKNENLDTNWDNSPPSLDYFRELERVSKHRIIWGANYYATGSLTYPCECLIIWNKQQSWPNFSAAEVAWTDYTSPFKTTMFTHQCNGEAVSGKFHPAQKPVPLYMSIYKKFATHSDRILDTHLGSGSNAIAASFYGVAEFVGVEIQEPYFLAAAEHVKHQTTNPLFEIT